MICDIANSDIRRLDGGLLLVFRELCRLRRTTEVAKKLGMSQPAVSHALGRLREAFGDELFLRLPHGVEPTARALDLAPRVEALIEAMGAALRVDPGFDPAQCTRRFNIAASEFAVALVEGALIKRLRARAPQASFLLTHARGYLALEAVRAGQVDLALGRFGPPPSGLVAQTLFEDRYCVVARRGHPSIRGAIDLETWMRAGHVLAATYAGVASAVIGEDPLPEDADFVTTAIVPRWETALSMVAGSDAIATCPRRLAEREGKRLALQILEPPLASIGFTVSLVRRDADDPALSWFAEQIGAIASEGLL